MTPHEAYLSYLDGLKQLARRVAGASVEAAFLQIETAWRQMSATDRLLVISKGGDPVSLLGGEPEVEKVYEFEPVGNYRPPRAHRGRGHIGSLCWSPDRAKGESDDEAARDLELED